MAYTLSKLLQDTYIALGQLRLGAATGGSTGALADDALAGASGARHADDEWKGGALFINEAGGQAPEGEFASVAGFEAASGGFTLASELSAPVEAGDRYGLASAYYPLETMVELANAGLRGLGELPIVEANCQTAASGSSFTSTLEWSKRRPLRIDLLAIPGVTAVDPWRTVHDWDYIPGAPGSPALILFADALPSGRPLRVWYQAGHPQLRAWDDPLAEALPPELAVAAAAERALRWQHARQGGSDARLAQQWEAAQLALAEARKAYPIWKPRRSARLLTVKR